MTMAAIGRTMMTVLTAVASLTACCLSESIKTGGLLEVSFVASYQKNAQTASFFGENSTFVAKIIFVKEYDLKIDREEN